MLRLPKSWRAEATAAPIAGFLGDDGAGEPFGTVGFRLLRPSGNLPPAAPDNRRSRRFTATILLENDWQPDIEAIAATTAIRFPTIGRIETMPAPSKEAPGALTVDGAVVTVRQLPGRVPPDRLNPPLETVRAWEPGNAIRRHVGAVEIGCGGELPGLEGAESYAAAVHFVATAACRVAPVSAVLWDESWAITDPGVFSGCAEQILEGRMPLGAWVSFALIGSGGFEPQEATGVVTYGMRAFIGRELALAPCPGGPRHAWRCITRISRMALDRGLVLQDGKRLSDATGEFAVTVRERNFRECGDQAAYVLVADDAEFDVDALQPRAEVA